MHVVGDVNTFTLLKRVAWKWKERKVRKSMKYRKSYNLFITISFMPSMLRTDNKTAKLAVASVAERISIHVTSNIYIRFIHEVRIDRILLDCCSITIYERARPILFLPLLQYFFHTSKHWELILGWNQILKIQYAATHFKYYYYTKTMYAEILYCYFLDVHGIHKTTHTHTFSVNVY